MVTMFRAHVEMHARVFEVMYCALGTLVILVKHLQQLSSRITNVFSEHALVSDVKSLSVSPVSLFA